MRRRWLFGDQLGPHFLDDPGQPVLMIESSRVLRRRAFHREKAHLLLSAMRHRAAELGEQCDYRWTDTYRAGLSGIDEPLDVVQPTSWAALHLVEALMTERELEGLPARGFATSRVDFAAWADGRGGKRLLLEDFYRDARLRLDLLMEGDRPVTGQWNYDADNRAAPPKTASLGVTDPWWPGGGRDRRAGAGRPRSTGSRWRRVRRGGWPSPVRRYPRGGPGRPEPLRRAPVARLRPLRGRHAERAIAGCLTRSCRLR